MVTTYINPNGEKKQADLSVEQVEKLKAKGVEVVADPFNDNAPAVSSKLTIHKASDDIGCQSCSA